MHPLSLSLSLALSLSLVLVLVLVLARSRSLAYYHRKQGQIRRRTTSWRLPSTVELRRVVGRRSSVGRALLEFMVPSLNPSLLEMQYIVLLASCYSSSLCAICSQQVGCHGFPLFSILCHSDTIIIWYLCPFLDVIHSQCSRSPPSSSTIYPSFHQQSLYPISSYYMSKILILPYFDSI